MTSRAQSGCPRPSCRGDRARRGRPASSTRRAGPARARRFVREFDDGRHRAELQRQPARVVPRVALDLAVVLVEPLAEVARAGSRGRRRRAGRQAPTPPSDGRRRGSRARRSRPAGSRLSRIPRRNRRRGSRPAAPAPAPRSRPRSPPAAPPRAPAALRTPGSGRAPRSPSVTSVSSALGLCRSSREPPRRERREQARAPGVH